MSHQAYHYATAETLLLEGQSTVDRISAIADKRKRTEQVQEMDDDYRDRVVAQLTRRMDELGKKAMGIWAQAHVHATLALATDEIQLSSESYDPRVIDR